MNTLRSSQFKTQYPHLTEPTEVTVNGHLIGTWQPAGPRPPQKVVDALRKAVEGFSTPASPKPVSARAAQKQRDEWLRRSSKP